MMSLLYYTDRCAMHHSNAGLTSQGQSLVDNPYFAYTRSSQQLGIDTAEVRQYTLTELLEGRGNTASGTGPLHNEKQAVLLMEKLCKEIDPETKMVVRSNIEIKGMSRLTPIHNISSSQRPDIIVYEDSKEEKVICTAEVRSSPMVVLERKATIGAAYLLRLLRYTDQDIKTITTFALPNMEEKQCVVQITLEWRDFQFVSNVKRHLNIVDACHAIKCVIQDQCRLPHLPLLDEMGDEVMELTPKECNDLCGGSEAIQMYCPTHLIVKSGDYVYKAIYSTTEFKNLTLVPQDHHPHFIVPERYANDLPSVFKYRYLPFSPLKRDQASKCLHNLVKGIDAALEALHECGLAHNDVRLPNVCFNERFQPVLIDLDRCSKSKKIIRPYGSSCMYSLMGFTCDNDYAQLGWLVAWVLDKDKTELDYHTRSMSDHSPFVNDDKFTSELVKTGVYNPDLLADSVIAKERKYQKSLEDVLKDVLATENGLTENAA